MLLTESCSYFECCWSFWGVVCIFGLAFYSICTSLGTYNLSNIGCRLLIYSILFQLLKGCMWAFKTVLSLNMKLFQWIHRASASSILGRVTTTQDFSFTIWTTEQCKILTLKSFGDISFWTTEPEVLLAGRFLTTTPTQLSEDL